MGRLMHSALCPFCRGAAAECWACEGVGFVSLRLADAITIHTRLRGAWLRRQAPDWPATLAECMASPMHARLILQEAERGDRERRERPQVVRPDPPSLGDSSPVTKADSQPVTKHDLPAEASKPLPIDNKRRAAGEKDDE